MAWSLGVLRLATKEEGRHELSGQVTATVTNPEDRVLKKAVGGYCHNIMLAN